MHPQKRAMLVINLLGGTAVLFSYAQGIVTHSDAAQVLWGGVPQAIRSLYTLSMFTAAAGYFAFTNFIFFHLSPDKTRVGGRFGFGLFNVFYVAILLPSALWLPLTFLAVEQASPFLVWLVKGVLWLVGAASLSLLAALLKVEPRHPTWAHRLALLGILAFCFQTAVLDALVWGSFFQLAP